MWIMTTKGFYSVVNNTRDPDWKTLLIRARSRVDLERFLDACAGFDNAEAWQVNRLRILSTPSADYPFRVVVPRAVWAEFMNQEIGGIDYPNFKNAVEERCGRKHAKAYLKVWSSLHELE